MKPYLSDTENVLSSLSTSANGLGKEEAKARLEKYGPNKLKEGKKESIIKKFFSELTEPMLIILMIAAVLSVVTSAIQGEVEYTDAIIILVVVLLNAILGVVQEAKAEAAIEALQNMSKAQSKVIRDGFMHPVESDELVPGDIVVLEAGDSVPADGRILEAASLKVEEAALTGESVPSEKHTDTLKAGENGDVPLGDRANMVYMGSTVVYGRAKAVITDTAMNTEMGKIASALDSAQKEETPLQIKLNQLSKILTYLVLGICVVIFVIDFIRMAIMGSVGISGILDTFMIAISLAVAAIPEGLAAVVTIVLSIGVTKMSRNKAIIRKLTAVETLGCTQIICSDKTGTLTQNKMTVVDYYSPDKALIAKAMALCSDSSLDENNNAAGEPTECALVNFAYKEGINKNEIEKSSEKRIGEAPFDSVRKLMSTVHMTENGIIQYTKGAPDVLLKKCTRILSSDGSIRGITDEDKKEILEKNKEFADKALRVLAAAERSWDEEPEYSADTLERDLVFVGLVGMIDPVRPEVKSAIEECRKAGIRPVMITGDHKDTAVAIAKELGIITDASQAITGSELNNISDEDLDGGLITKYSVYARVQPEHKVRIVNAWKKQSKVVAMTGDGVNDAPSIKNADIGVGMGITGTDVTKNVADMVLADDNFATIVSAVAEGRRIYDNIRKAIQFLLGSNFAEVLSIFVASLLGFTILKPSHLLWINLITDSFPAIGLGMEAGEKDLMSRPPRDKNEGVFANSLGFNAIFQGCACALITLVAYFVGEYIENGAFRIVNSSDGMTMAFLTLSMAEMIHSFNMRSMKDSIFTLKGHNKFLYASLIGAFVLTVLVLYVPFLNDVFGFEHISLFEFFISLLLAACIVPIVEIQKLVQRRMKKA